MSTVALRPGGREAAVSLAVLLSCIGLLVLGATSLLPALETAFLAAAVVWITAAHRELLRWRTLLAVTILIVLFIPANRYALPLNAPIELDPYRVWMLLVLGLWIACLLADPRVRLRGSGLDVALLSVCFASFASVGTNLGRVGELDVQTDVVRRLTFLASFALVFYLVLSVVRNLDQVFTYVKVITAGGAIIACSALVEARTGYNAFNNLSSAIPFLEPHVFSGEVVTRGGRVRAYASSQNALALGALLGMLVPLALYVARRTRAVRWWVALGAIGIATLSTGSRTSVVMCLVAIIVFLWLRPVETVRLWPLLLPALVAVHFALPGALGSFKKQFFPEGGLIAQQSKHAGWSGSGRIADLSPGLSEWKEKPLLGQGYGTRVTNGARRNALILDDQWLKTLIETGLVGALAWAWLFVRFIRRAGRESKRDPTDRGWLLAALTASTAAFAVAMIFFDAFSFVQVTFMLFVLLALGAVTLREGAAPAAPRRSV